MVDTLEPASIIRSLTSPEQQGKGFLKLIQNNYEYNLDSDYTEKIEELDRHFDYGINSNHYWSEPELSTLYGTPLYEAASSSQKIALNHLAWVSQYNHIANSETEAVHYNQITANSFAAIGSEYEAIAHLIDHETAQERSHIHAFYKVSYRTIKALLGKEAFNIQANFLSSHLRSSPFSNYQYQALHLIAKMMLIGQEQNYSQRLKQLEAESKRVASTNGFFHGRGLIPQSLIQFIVDSWGSSPFLSCQYYVLRYMANMLLKNKERSILQYCKKLQKQGEFVPAPTSISRYHFLDEAFHTTTSLFLARDFYKQLPEPTAYKKFVTNMTIYMAQQSNLSGLSGAIMSIGDDRFLMGYIYKLLRSRLFSMSEQDALHWMEKCFCQEHEGFHLSAKLHQRLLSDFRRLFADMDYLWSVNREMRSMAANGSIHKSIQNNIKTFKQFSKSVATASR
jgi:hypothetical protein